MTIERKGPLAGIRVLELPNIGPLQHAGMILADLGAEVLRLERKAHVDAGTGLQGPYTPFSVLDRGRCSAGVDLKHPRAAELVARLAERADVLVEGFRPRVAERFGVGPDVLCARNPRLVYGRMTGWGHDVNVDRFLRPMEVLGRGGTTLEEAWRKGPRAYMAISVPDFPNLFLLNGPNAPVGNFSLIEVDRMRKGEAARQVIVFD